MSHARQTTKSYQIRENARQEALRKKDYSSEQTRLKLQTLFRERFGKDPYQWQVDVTEALLLGLDCVVIAGTGAGKTMPFMMPLLLDKDKSILIISPLKVLQADQAERFEVMELSAAAVNGDTWSADLQRVTSPAFSDRVCAVVVDEAHCISQWGGDFRKNYGVLQKLRGLFPPNIPFLATSATLPPDALREVRASLAIDSDSSFFLNLGNDRPNITYSAQSMKSSSDFNALRPLLSQSINPTSHDNLIKTIVFMNTIPSTQIAQHTIRSWFPRQLRKFVDCVHARRSPKAKRRSMRRFRQGKTRILVATEVAGMGADIPDIVQVIQFGIPSSLSVWIQRAGRAGRSPEINARAILLYEESMFKRKRRRRTKPAPGAFEEGSDADPGIGHESEVDDHGEDNQGEDDEGPSDEEDDGKEWGKKVEENLRRWIETAHCRRDIADEYFDNPPERKHPTGPCCDNCAVDYRLQSPKSMLQRPSTPERPTTPPGSVHSTPSKSTNVHGKRPMQSHEDYLPAKRRGDHLKDARAALEAWRFDVKRNRYTPSPFTAATILPDPVITTLASNGVGSVDDIPVLLKATVWPLVHRHGQEVLAVLRQIDAETIGRREEAKRAKKDEQQRATEARRHEKRLRDEQERKERQVEKDRKRAETQARKEAENAEKKRLKDAASVAKKQAAAAQQLLRRSTKALRGLPLGGSSVFNVSPQTPFPQTQYQMLESSPVTPALSRLGHSQQVGPSENLIPT
ncbi:P-loop containing nucleoside triphosphate hydrolase protein [Lyophyllum atratum]|nr:P-loop containing nucleoside triphosphate hydrolase protein [Lyophyllum atratum]